MSLLGAQGIKYKETSTVQQHGLLDLAMTKKGLFAYTKASGAFTIYDFIKVDDDGLSAQLTTTLSAAEPTLVGAVQVAFASSDYGWAFVGPGGGLNKAIKGTVLASYVADSKLYTTATAGAADDTATDCIQHAKGITTNGGSTAAIEIYAVGTMCTNGQD